MLPSSTAMSQKAFELALTRVNLPGRYVGGEINQIVKNPDDVDLRWALIYPDTYEIGMPHQGLRILYHCLNEKAEIWAERCFTPWVDMEQEYRSADALLGTLESRTPLADLDIVGFTLQSELTYTNLLTTLDLGGVALRSEDRSLKDPFVVAGGAGCLNPEPLANFVDFFLLGDGEEAVIHFSHVFQKERGLHSTRHEFLRAVNQQCPYIYTPALWTAKYDGPALLSMTPEEDVGTPQNAVVYDLENAPYPTAPIVPSIRTIHDRITVEIMRGCVEGCRFCQAGMEKRPQRFRSKERVLEIVKESYRNTGFNEVGLTSLSSSDHPDLLGIMDTLLPFTAPKNISLSLPSLRVNEQVAELPKRIAEARKQGITLAPEVATNRLRGIINKGISDDDLFAGAKASWVAGFNTIKLYFMIGIPGEEEADVTGIVDMAETCSILRAKAGMGGNGQVNAAVSTFIPKALTPFQWAPQLRPEEVKAKQKFLWDRKRVRAVRIKCHVSDETMIDGFLSRADRRAGRVLERAWKEGARFDAWMEQVNLQAWTTAWEAEGYGPEEVSYRNRSVQECMPWDHLHLGVSREYLEEEWIKSQSGALTPHCQTEACGDCGVGAKTCVDIKAASGFFSKYSRPKFIARAEANPLFQIGLPQETLPPKGSKVASSSQERNSCTPSESRG